eukprot:TRINITY_DN1127_c0_g1_i1.p1 TRINITY_DN1127_c0_g1~~TRINITY_DN1127_c0_g1_i1.p1  ORF type:complete len:214 (+),score=30.41 TRINITY_DN1127_c0_g1_i1:54-695(+)
MLGMASMATSAYATALPLPTINCGNTADAAFDPQIIYAQVMEEARQYHRMKSAKEGHRKKPNAELRSNSQKLSADNYCCNSGKGLFQEAKPRRHSWRASFLFWKKQLRKSSSNSNSHIRNLWVLPKISTMKNEQCSFSASASSFTTFENELFEYDSQDSSRRRSKPLLSWFSIASALSLSPTQKAHHVSDFPYTQLHSACYEPLHSYSVPLQA